MTDKILQGFKPWQRQEDKLALVKLRNWQKVAAVGPAGNCTDIVVYLLLMESIAFSNFTESRSDIRIK